MSSNDIPTLLLRLSVVVATIQHQLYCGAFGVSAPSWLSSKLHVNIRSPPARASRPPSRYHHSTEPRTIGTQPSTGWPSAGYAPASGWSGPFFGDLGTNSVSTNRGRGSQQVSMTAGVAGRSTSITAGSRSVNWPLWYVLPIAPYQRRKTLMKEVVPGKVCGCPRVCRILWYFLLFVVMLCSLAYSRTRSTIVCNTLCLHSRLLTVRYTPHYQQ